MRLDRVLVKPDPKEDRYEGILLSPADQLAPRTGTVVDTRVADLSGARVLYNIHAGFEIELGGQEHIILRDQDIIATL